MAYPIYTGDEARTKLSYLLESVGPCTQQYQERLLGDMCCGYYKTEKCWVAFDNRSDECFVEDYPSEDMCIKYINHEIS